MQTAVKKYFFTGLKLGVAFLLLWHVGKDLDYGSLKKLSPAGLCTGFLLSMFLILLQTTLTALRWNMLLQGQGIKLSFFRVLSLTFQGNMFSLFLPGGSVGGDVLKAAFLAKEAKKSGAVEGVTTILLDRLIGMLGLFSLTGMIALCSLGQIRAFPAGIRYTVYLLMFCCVGGVLGGILIFLHTLLFKVQIFAKLLQKADSFTKGTCSRILHAVEVCRKDRATFWKTFFLTLLILHPILIGCNILILYSLDNQKTENIALAQKATLAASLGNVASVAPVSPGGLGTRDKVTEIILQASGIRKEKCALVPLIYSCASVLSALLPGLFFFLWDAFGKLRSGIKE
ncbi:MAG: flippase-like domain-containing protein [Lentisphaeria bacterium]|nr:flippase-like domain-containing protein [Lentisphaeria bacterium]